MSGEGRKRLFAMYKNTLFLVCRAGLSPQTRSTFCNITVSLTGNGAILPAYSFRMNLTVSSWGTDDPASSSSIPTSFLPSEAGTSNVLPPKEGQNGWRWCHLLISRPKALLIPQASQMRLPGIKSKEGNRKSLGATVLWLGGDQFDLTGIINYQGIIMKYFYSSKHFLCWLLNSKVLNCISFDEFSCMSSYDKEKVVFESRKYMSWSCISFHTRFHSDSHHVGKYVHDSFCPQWAPAFSWPWPLWKEIAKRKILVCPMNL